MAAPADGQANDAVCDLLLAVTGASTAQVIAGHTNPLKTVRLTGVTRERTRRLLAKNG